MPPFVIPERCRDLAALQVSQYPDDPSAFDWITERELDAFLPKIDKPRRVIDLGCGLGRVACGLHMAYNDPEIEYILADANRHDGPPATGWNPGEEWYNLFELTVEFCEANGLRNYRTWDLLKHPHPPDADLTVSMLSVGFHWPLNDWLKPWTKTEQMVFGCRAGIYSAGPFAPHFRSVEVAPGFCDKEEIFILKGMQ